MTFPWNSKEEELAISALDNDIHRHLELLSQVKQILIKKSIQEERWCGNIVLSGRAERPFEMQPEGFNRSDLEALDRGLTGMKGAWSVYWHTDAGACFGDKVRNDGFRVVVQCRTIEFGVRPLREHDPIEPWDGRIHVKRLRFGAGDVKDCISNVLNTYRSQNMSAVTGSGLAIHPDDRSSSRTPTIPFEWKIDRLPPQDLKVRVHKWRVDTCQGRDPYNRLKKQYESFRSTSGAQAFLPPPGQHPNARLRIHKRRSQEGGSLGEGPVRNNRRRIRGPEPSTSSPDMLFLPAVGGYPRPPPVTSSNYASAQLAPSIAARAASAGHGRTRTKKASTDQTSTGFGSANSAVSEVTRELSGMALTSSALASAPPGPAYGQPGPAQAPRPSRAYGDGVDETHADRSRELGILPESVRYRFNSGAFTSQQAAPEGGGYNQLQLQPPAPGTYTGNMPPPRRSPSDEMKRQVFGSALQQIEEEQRKLDAEQQQRRINEERRRLEEERWRREASTERGGEASPRPYQGTPPPTAPPGGWPGQGVGGGAPRGQNKRHEKHHSGHDREHRRKGGSGRW